MRYGNAIWMGNLRRSGRWRGRRESCLVAICEAPRTKGPAYTGVFSSNQVVSYSTTFSGKLVLFRSHCIYQLWEDCRRHEKFSSGPRNATLLSLCIVHAYSESLSPIVITSLSLITCDVGTTLPPTCVLPSICFGGSTSRLDVCHSKDSSSP